MNKPGDFDAAFEIVLGHEKGFVNHPADPGKATKYGITMGTLARWRKRPVSVADVKALTVDEAKAIYKAWYWDAVRGDELPHAMAVELFDAAVNHGPRQAVLWAQRALRKPVAADGQLGPITLAALQQANQNAWRRRFNGHRLQFFSDRKIWPTFGRGWARRVSANLLRNE